MILRRVASLLAAALLAGIAALPAAAQPKDKAILLLNWYVYSEHAPFFLGKERGYFDQEGIDLDIQEGRGSGVTVQAVAAGTATFGYADVPTMIKAAAKGAPTRSPTWSAAPAPTAANSASPARWASTGRSRSDSRRWRSPTS